MNTTSWAFLALFLLCGLALLVLMAWDEVQEQRRKRNVRERPTVPAPQRQPPVVDV